MGAACEPGTGSPGGEGGSDASSGAGLPITEANAGSGADGGSGPGTSTAAGPSGGTGGEGPAPAPNAYPGHGFVGHEWGTGTIIVGSDGSTQRGLQHEEEDLACATSRRATSRCSPPRTRRPAGP